MTHLRRAAARLATVTAICGVGVGVGVAVVPASAQTPTWAEALGYLPSQVFHVRIGNDGFPYVPVRIDGTELWLLFDTGNMAGLTLDTRQYDRLDAQPTGEIRRRNSDGELVGTFRVGRVRRVEALGHTWTDVTVREFEHPRLAGLFGPGDLPGTRFTLDYRAGVIAVASDTLASVAGTDARPLVRSHRHPRLTLVEGAFRGRPVLIELDTGKSRTVVDPDWAASVGLDVERTDAVVVGRVRIGDATFEIRNAKPVGLGGIDPDLPAPLVLSLGSDTLSRFVLTVDYVRGLLLLVEP